MRLPWLDTALKDPGEQETPESLFPRALHHRNTVLFQDRGFATG
jgi:hypothetical protein